MSVLIKGMKIPKTCDECWALDDYEYPRCRITQEQRGYDFPIREKRMDRCPLVPIPAHGRLIDADALDNTLGIDNRNNYVHWILEDAPTIISAESKEET